MKLKGSGWTAKAGLFVFLALLLLVSNPELRALLLLVDALGLELLVLLALSQSRILLPMVGGHAGLVWTAYGPLLSRAAALLLATARGLLPRALLWLEHGLLWTRAMLSGRSA